jgi:hypothetical protein
MQKKGGGEETQKDNFNFCDMKCHPFQQQKKNDKRAQSQGLVVTLMESTKG